MILFMLQFWGANRFFRLICLYRSPFLFRTHSNFSNKLSESWKLKNCIFILVFFFDFLAWIYFFSQLCKTPSNEFKTQFNEKMKNSIDFKVDSNGWWNNLGGKEITDYVFIFMSSNNCRVYFTPPFSLINFEKYFLRLFLEKFFYS